MSERRRKRLWLCLPPLLALLTHSGCGRPDLYTPFNKAEIWVFSQVKLGLHADLAEFSDDEDERTIRGPMLASILTGRVHRYWLGGRALVDPPTGQIIVRNAKVIGDTYLLSSGMDYELHLLDCSFEGRFSTRGTFLRPLVITGSSFKSIDCSLSTIPLIIGWNCTFEGSANFGHSNVGRMDLSGSKFTDPDETALFGQLASDGDFIMSNVVFEGGADFGGCQIGHNLVLNAARFEGEQRKASFNGVQVGRSAFFMGSTFNGPPDFRAAEIGWQIHFRGARFLSQDSGPSFSLMRVGDAARFSTAEFAGPIDLSGMEYKILVVPDRLALLNRAVYSENIYRTLEASLKNLGLVPEANQVYVAMKRRERRERLTGFSWCWSHVLDRVVGYGRYPHHAFWWMGGFILIGSLVFRKRFMERRHQGEPRAYNAFFYSLDAFLPVVDLDWHKPWRPKAQGWGWLVNVWLIIHIISGWVLITLLLAALVGILR